MYGLFIKSSKIMKLRIYMYRIKYLSFYRYRNIFPISVKRQFRCCMGAVTQIFIWKKKQVPFQKKLKRHVRSFCLKSKNVEYTYSSICSLNLFQMPTYIFIIFGFFPSGIRCFNFMFSFSMLTYFFGFQAK